MKYVEFMKYVDDEGKEILDERRDRRIVDISAKDAKQMNEPNQHGEGSLAYRKATKEDIAKFAARDEASAPEPIDEDPEGLIEDKPYAEWTVGKLKTFAEAEELELTGTRKAEIWQEIIDALADPLD